MTRERGARADQRIAKSFCFRPLTDVLTRKSNGPPDFIALIPQKLTINVPTLVTSASHKITAKCGILCPKTLVLNGETAPRHTFLCSDLQCLPPGDPIILCA